MQVATLVAVLCALAFFNTAEAGTGSGKCPQTRKPMQNFDLSKYEGHWFEIAKLDGSEGDRFKCNQWNFGHNPVDGIDIKNVVIDTYYYDQPTSSEGRVILAELTGAAKLNGWLHTEKTNDWKNVNWWVLDTDYESYSIVYSCSDNGISYQDAAWIYSRKAEQENKHRAEVDKVLRANGIEPSDKFTPLIQDCGIIV